MVLAFSSFIIYSMPGASVVAGEAWNTSISINSFSVLHGYILFWTDWRTDTAARAVSVYLKPAVLSWFHWSCGQGSDYSPARASAWYPDFFAFCFFYDWGKLPVSFCCCLSRFLLCHGFLLQRKVCVRQLDWCAVWECDAYRSKALGEIINNKDLTLRTSIIGPELKRNGEGLFHWFMQQAGKI